MADKDFLDKNGTSYLWGKTKQKIDAAKTTIDNYMINGKKVSDNPTLMAVDIGAAPVVGGKIPAQYIPTAMDDVVYIMNYASGVITEDELESAEEGRLTTLPEGWSISEHVYYESTLQVFYVYAWSEDTDSIYFQWDKIGDLASSDNYGNNKAISVAGKNIIAKTKSPNVIYRNVSVDTIAYEGAGEEGKVYVDTISNKTYRWGGSSFVIIGTDLALGETSETAFAGDKGKEVYDAVFTKNKNVAPNVLTVTGLVIKNNGGTELTSPPKGWTALPSITTSGNNKTLNIEYGMKVDYSVTYKWTHNDNYKDPEAVSSDSSWKGQAKPLSGVASNPITGTNVSTVKTITAKTEAKKIGLMVSGTTVTPATGLDYAKSTFNVVLKKRRYWGIVDGHGDISKITAADILALQEKDKNGNYSNTELTATDTTSIRKKTINITISDTQSYLFAYEAAAGEVNIKTDLDQNDFWSYRDIDVTNELGVTIKYRVYMKMGTGGYVGKDVNFNPK